jgi:4-diphosphocytidyl-2-C-methyl-D-erythritol kinase
MRVLQAYAKVNLMLRVRPRDASGLHPIHSLAQSIDIADQVAVGSADDDRLTVEGGDPIEAGTDNLVWVAIEAVRTQLRVDRPVAAALVKRIPVAAGLGGGSADAAAALVLAAALFGGSRDDVDRAAPGIGADVPFCVTGGTLWMDGDGRRLSPAGSERDYHLAVAVAPFPLHTAAVYGRWDDLGGPTGPGVSGRSLPPSLRGLAPLVNDLVPAARSLRPEFGDWVQAVAAAWGRPVIMSGSGPAVAGFFPTRDEAADAAGMADARFSAAASPVDRGWDGDPGGTLPPPPWGVV